MSDYEILINKAQKLHGEICPGVIMGTRMSMAAMKELNMNPLEPNENLIVCVEVDRCMPDAIQALTGCTVGRRTLKCLDYGKFVATFTDMETGRRIRVSARDDKIKSLPGLWTWFENVSKLAKEKNIPKIMEEKKSGIKKLSKMSDDELLLIEELDVEIPVITGLPKDITTCSICGEHVMDGKEFKINNKVVCRSCANENINS
jgi:formylmethanofuran dehydrogenase subunit E